MSYLPPHMRNIVSAASSSNSVDATSRSKVPIIPPSDPSVVTQTTRNSIGFWSKFDRESLDGIGKKIRKQRITKSIDPKDAEKEEYDRYVRTVQDEMDRVDKNSNSDHADDIDNMIVDDSEWCM